MNLSFLEAVPDCPTEYSESLYWPHSSSYLETCNGSNEKPVYGNVPLGFSLASSFASIIGSLITVLPYVLWKDIRTGVREIITFLAIADFFTAFGYVMASFNYLSFRHYHKEDPVEACKQFDVVCQIQAYISSWGSLSSFFWTSILAFYLYWTIAKGDFKLVNRLFPFYHILSWGVPIFIMFPLLVTGSLGYSLISAGGWCFIKDRQSYGHDIQVDTTFDNYKVTTMTIILVFVGGKAVELFTYAWVITLYAMIQYKIRKSKREMRDGVANLLQRVERKMFAIPVMFIVLRMWGTIQFFLSIIVFNNGTVNVHTGCMPKALYWTFYVLAVLQSIGDGGQGWCNAILYIIWAPKIRHRLYSCLCSCCCEFTSLFFESLSFKKEPRVNRRPVTESSTSFLPINYRTIDNGGNRDQDKDSMMETISGDKNNA